MIKTFCDPFLEAVEEDRRDCHLRSDDIDRALEFFGPGLVKLYINPMYLSGKTKLDYTFPENLEVVGHAGVAGWELQGDVKEDKNSTTEKQVPEKETPDTVLNRPDKVLVASGVVTSPSDGKEHQDGEGNPVNSHSRKSILVNSDKTSDKTPLIMKHGGGRPRKIGGLSPRTLYRRKKELAQQKEMLPL